jgi:hypothetical protein
LVVPPPVQVGHRRRQVVGFGEAEPADLVAVPVGEGEDVVAQGGLETPFGVGAVGVGCRRRPPVVRDAVAAQVVGDTRAAVLVLLGWHAAHGAELEHVPLVDGRGGPALSAFGEVDGSAGGEGVGDEPLVGGPSRSRLTRK